MERDAPGGTRYAEIRVGMKTRDRYVRRHRIRAFSRKELTVVIAVVVLLALFIIPAVDRVSNKSKRIGCIGNLKELGLAYRIWANDNGDQYPAFAAISNGGWSNILHQTNTSVYAWTNYAIMANALGQSAVILACPADERRPAADFAHLANTNISYFIGVNASDTFPQSILGGDRNLEPGTTPTDDFGFSPADGKGNDVIIRGPVCWTLKMHSRRNDASAGNILLGDGSAQQVASQSLNVYWLTNQWVESSGTGNDTNPPPVRFIFP